MHTFALFFLIQTLAVVSGAHFNPAVTVALTAIRQIRVIDAAIYIVLQLAGGVLGALVTKLILNNLDNAKAVHFGAPKRQRRARPARSGSACWWRASAPSSSSGRSWASR